MVKGVEGGREGSQIKRSSLGFPKGPPSGNRWDEVDTNPEGNGLYGGRGGCAEARVTRDELPGQEGKSKPVGMGVTASGGSGGKRVLLLLGWPFWGEGKLPPKRA